MQKLMKNWIFTLIVCILLGVLALLMFLDGFGVGDIYLGQQIIHLITAVVLALYVIFGLCPLVPRYNGTSRAFLLLEIVVLLITVVAQVCNQFFEIPLVARLQVCSVLGLAMWLRGAVLCIRGYLLQGGEDENKMPLWRFCCYILLSAVGVWQLVRPLISNTYFIFCIGTVSLIFAIIFAVFTVQNHRALPKKVKKTEEPEALPVPVGETAAVVPAEGETAPEPVKTEE